MNFLFVHGVGLVRNSVDEGLMCVLPLNVMELLSCCGSLLWARPCIVFQ